MPAPFRVILTAQALSDLDHVAGYIRQESPQNAATVAKRILNAIDSLEFMASRYRRVGKSRKRGSPIHAMLVRPYLVYYRIQESPPAVYVLTIRHGRQRQPRRFD